MYSYVPPKVTSVHDHDDEPSTEGLDGSEMGETTEENGDVMEALSTITEPILTTKHVLVIIGRTLIHKKV